VSTIQIRDVPEESYEILRGRARRAGQSLQAYMREEVVALAGRPTKKDSLDAIEAVLGRLATQDPTAESIVDDLAAGRR